MQMAATAATARTQPPTYHVYLTKYSYDPVQYSPNDNPDMELPLTAGEYLFIYGDMDEDGFYEGELLDGRRGLVPSNFVERVPAEELEDFRQLPPSYCNGGTSTTATNRANGTAAKTQTTEPALLQFAMIKAEINAKKMRQQPQMLSDGGSTTSTTSARVRNATTPPDVTSSTTAASNGSLGREPTTATAAAGARPVTITEIIDNIDVSPPANLRLERQLSTSFIIAWEAPTDIPSDQIVCYNVYSNELFLTTVKGNDRCKALLEKLDPNKRHQISVRTVTSKGQSKDHLCAITIGGGEPTSLTPTGLRVTEVSTKSAVVSWFPAESGLHHVITVNKHNRTVIRPGCCRCLVNGLAPDAEHTVHISALDPQTQTPSTPESVTFLTLSEDLPDAPVDVQVEVGPQRGTLLVTWMPALRHKHAGSVAAGSGPESVDRIAITGYVVYVDGTKVKQLDSPSGDHVLLDSRSFASFPADPKLVTVRTAAAGDRESRDSRPAMLSDQMLEEIRTGMMLKEVELNPVGTSAVGGSRNTSDSTGSSPVDQIPSMDAGSADGYRSRDGYKLRYGSRLHPRAVPHIEITRDAMSGGSSGADDSDGSSTRHRTPGGTRRRSKQTEDGRVEPTGSRQYGSTEDPADRLSRHRTRQQVQQSADWTSPAGPRIRNRGAPDPVGADFFNSDPEAVDDSLIGADSDLEFGPSSASCHAYPSVSSRSHAHFHAHRRGHQSPRSGSNYRLFIALFDYDPSTMSPNPGAIEEELPFLEGQLIKIHGDKDADGFYLGEMDGRRGLVPCNMVSEVHVDSPDIAERWLRENSPTPPPGFSGPRKAGSRTAAGPSSPRSAHTRSHRPMEYDQRRRPSDRPLMGPGPPLPPGAVPRHRLPAARKMVAIYDYDPRELSPNVDVEQELSFKMGDVIIVYGDPDYDGFYRGKLGSRRGLVPSNFLRPAPPSSSGSAVVPPVRHGPPGPSQQSEYHHQQQQHLPPDVINTSDPSLQITPHAGNMMMMESRDLQHQQPPNLEASMSAAPQQQMTTTNQQSAVRSRADPTLDQLQLQQQQPENGGASSSIRQNYISGAMPTTRMSGPTIAGVGMTDVESTQMKQRRLRDPASVY